MRHMIPSNVLAPIVREYIDRMDMGYVYQAIGAGPRARYGYSLSEDHGECLTGARYSPEQALAYQAGVSDKLIREMLSGRRKHIIFEAADKIVCAMGSPWLWWQKPLSDHYFAPGDEPPSPEVEAFVRMLVGA